jgi:hypothetical protein
MSSHCIIEQKNNTLIQILEIWDAIIH